MGLSWLAFGARPGLESRTFRVGLVDALAFVPSTALLGVIFGAGAQAAGIGQVAAVAMSAFVWSGSGQFAALPLWGEGGLVVILSCLVLSLRFSLMTAAMAPHLAGRSPVLSALLGFVVTDENFALSFSRRGGRVEPAYVAGSGVALYVPWVIGTLVGVLFGAQVPAWLSAPLNAVFPLVFLILVVLTCATRAAAGVAVLGGLLGLIGYLLLPGGWHVIAAGLLASLAGPLLERLFGGAKRDQTA